MRSWSSCGLKKSSGKIRAWLNLGSRPSGLRKVAVGKKERAKETNYYKVYTKKQITLIFEENGWGDPILATYCPSVVV